MVDWKMFAFKEAFEAKGAAGKLAGFADCCSVAFFSFTGTELVAITAWETEYPRHTLPKVVRRVAYRIIFYYLAAVLILGLTVSPNDALLSLPLSPAVTDPNDPHPLIYRGAWVVMALRAGLGSAVPDIINGVMIIATVSVATLDIYVAVKWLHHKANNG